MRIIIIIFALAEFEYLYFCSQISIEIDMQNFLMTQFCW